jgi:hypothetical protein
VVPLPTVMQMSPLGVMSATHAPSTTTVASFWTYVGMKCVVCSMWVCRGGGGEGRRGLERRKMRDKGMYG